jgi:polyhydroxyalkanoate synthesis regulator phasin
MVTQISLLILWIVVLAAWWKTRSDTEQLSEKIDELEREIAALRDQSASR